jgi:hypothetical protein
LLDLKRVALLNAEQVNKSVSPLFLLVYPTEYSLSGSIRLIKDIIINWSINQFFQCRRVVNDSKVQRTVKRHPHNHEAFATKLMDSDKFPRRFLTDKRRNADVGQVNFQNFLHQQFFGLPRRIVQWRR